MSKHHEVTAEVEVSRVIEKIWYPLIGAVVAFGVLYGGYLGYSYYAETQEAAAQEKLFTLEKRVSEKNDEIKKAEEKAEADKEDKSAKKDPKKDQMAEYLKKAADAAKKEEAKTSTMLQERFGDVLKDYQTFIVDYRGKKASFMAAVQAAGLAQEYKDLELAEKILTAAIGDQKKMDLFAGFVRAQLGSVYLDKKKYAEASAEFQKVIDAKDLTAFHPQALLRLGVSYYSVGDMGKAEKAWDQLEKDHPLTQAAEQAKGYKKLITLKKGSKS